MSDKTYIADKTTLDSLVATIGTSSDNMNLSTIGGALNELRAYAYPTFASAIGAKNQLLFYKANNTSIDLTVEPNKLFHSGFSTSTNISMIKCTSDNKLNIADKAEYILPVYGIPDFYISPASILGVDIIYNNLTYSSVHVNSKSIDTTASIGVFLYRRYDNVCQVFLYHPDVITSATTSVNTTVGSITGLSGSLILNVRYLYN